MRIGLSCKVIEPALCQGKIDGIGSFTQGLYQELQKQEHSVIPVIFPSFKNLRPRCLLPQSEVLPQPYTLAAGFSTLLKLDTRGASKLETKIDLYHCTDYLVPRFKKIPVLAMIHDAVKIQHPQWNGGKLRSLKSWGLKKAVQWADHYIAPSQAVVAELVEYFGLPEEKITVIHNALSPYWLEKVGAAEKQAVLDKYQLRPDFILFTGTFQPRKNLGRILAAFKALPAALQSAHPLVLVGQQGWLENSLLDEIKKLSLQGKLRWLNYIEQAELRCLYQSARLFLFPSLHEGFGLPILEAFASETPVLTSKLFAMPEVAGGAASLVDPYCVDEIQAEMRGLLENEAARSSLIRRGRERVRAFSWDKCLQAHLEVYQQLL